MAQVNIYDEMFARTHLDGDIVCDLDFFSNRSRVPQNVSLSGVSMIRFFWETPIVLEVVIINWPLNLQKCL